MKEATKLAVDTPITRTRRYTVFLALSNNALALSSLPSKEPSIEYEDRPKANHKVIDPKSPMVGIIS
jgi:hypothetical protein